MIEPTDADLRALEERIVAALDGDDGAVDVLGYGEISTVVALDTDDPAVLLGQSLVGIRAEATIQAGQWLAAIADNAYQIVASEIFPTIPLFTLAGFVHVETGCYLGQACTIKQYARVGRGSLIGMGATILNGAKIGKGCLIGANALITEGKTIAEPLEKSGVFPPMVCQMIGVGEQTGAMDTMLSKIADFYEDEVDAAVEGMMALLEPVMIAFLGVVIGIIVVAMYLPMFTLISQIG